MATKTAIVRIKDNATLTINYSTLEELSQEISEVLFRLEIGGDYGDVTVEREPGKITKWNFSIAHYCYDHGRLSEREFVQWQYFCDHTTGEPLEEVAA